MRKLNLSSTEEKYKHNLTTSKGNQPKFFDKNNNFIKYDSLGYEGLSEIICSRLLSISSCNSFVKYSEIKSDYGNRRGCLSKNFLLPEQKVITLYRLFQSNSINIEKQINNLSIKDKILFTCNIVTKLTGLDNFFEWLISVLKFDFLVLNEDRHFNNLGLIYNNSSNKFSLMPVFDNGAALLSDLQQYPLYYSINDNIKKVHGKPFSTNFKKQFDVCCELSETRFIINYDKVNLIMKNDFLYYTDEEIKRCLTLLENRLRLYRKYFDF